MYFGALDEQTGASVLLLEDLGTGRVGDDAAGCTDVDAFLVAERLGRFHGGWWGDARLDRMDWLPVCHDGADTSQTRFEAMWDPWLAKFDGMVPASLRAIGPRLGSRLAAVRERLAVSPLTLQHGDMRLDNLMFGLRGDGWEFAALDWQFPIRARGPWDLAYFLCWSLHPEQRRSLETRLVRRYLEELTGAGVADYDEERCWTDLRLAMVATFDRVVLGGFNVDLANPRARAFLAAVIARYAAAFADHRILADHGG